MNRWIVALAVAAGLVGLGEVEGAVEITLADFNNPTVLDFEGLAPGPISGTDPYFTSVGISSVSVINGAGAGDPLSTNVDGNSLASVNGLLSIVAPNGPLDNGISAGFPEFTFNFAQARDKLGVMITDQTGVFRLTFENLGVVVDTFSYNTGSGPLRYVQTVALFDSMIVDHPSFTGGYGIDNVTLEDAVIPEPGTFLIWFLLGALGITAGWWRRRQAG